MPGPFCPAETKALCALAVELQAQAGDDFLAPALAARLLTQDPADCCAWAEKQLLRTGLLGTRVCQGAVRPFRYVLGNLWWDRQRGVYVWSHSVTRAGARPGGPFRRWISGGFPCWPGRAAGWIRRF